MSVRDIDGNSAFIIWDPNAFDKELCYTGLFAQNSGGNMRRYIASAASFLVSLPLYPDHPVLLMASMTLMTILIQMFWTGAIQIKFGSNDSKGKAG